VVADERNRRAIGDDPGARVGLGAVADDVTERPDLLDVGFVDLGHHRLECGQVPVDVGDHGEAHGSCPEGGETSRLS
jgi:hypothetical protein